MFPLHPIFKVFSSSLDVDCEQVRLQLLMELQGLEDLKSKFLACPIFNFYKKNDMLPSG